MQLNDTFSMLGGLAFGRRRLAPVLSPAKTWEGAGAGLVAAGAGAALFRFALPDVSTLGVHGLAVVLALAGTAGGLCASALKRAAGKKDFGAVFPGHGGVLDRFDSALFAAPLLWLLLLPW
jgi:phosphatidate cytidylyltransferase